MHPFHVNDNMAVNLSVNSVADVKVGNRENSDGQSATECVQYCIDGTHDQEWTSLGASCTDVGWARVHKLEFTEIQRRNIQMNRK